MAKEMTIEEVIRILRRMQNQEAYDPQITEVAYKALDIAINTLEEKEKHRRSWEEILEEARL